VGLGINKRTKEVSVRAWRGICRSPINCLFGTSRVGAKAYRGEAIPKRVVRGGNSDQLDLWRTLETAAPSDDVVEENILRVTPGSEEATEKQGSISHGSSAPPSTIAEDLS